MKYMLDTNICVFLIKRRPESVILKFMEQEPGDTAVSSITYAELMHGVEKSEAKSLDLVLVTNNTREFARVNGLRLEDWVKGVIGYERVDCYT